MTNLVAFLLIMFFVLMLSLAGWPLLFSKILRRQPEQIILASLALAIVALYSFALCGRVIYGIWFVFAAGLIAFAIWVYICAKEGRTAFSESFTPGFAIFIVCAVLARWKFADACYTKWDEFSHWGFAVKEILARHSLSTAGDALIFRDYPPGAALFHSFASLVAGYSEGNTYFSQSLLLMGPLAGLLAIRKNPVLSSSAYIGAMALLLTFANGYKTLNSLYVDQIIAIWFGMAIAIYLSSKRDLRDIIIAILPLAALPLIKEAGLFLAITAGAVIALDVLRQKTGGK